MVGVSQFILTRLSEALAVAVAVSLFLAAVYRQGKNVIGYHSHWVFWLRSARVGLQHLVALLDLSDIVPNLHHAYKDPRFMTAKYAVLMTGPSATADIEGVLVRGAQGIRSLKLIPAPRGTYG
jgi:hypothetical protein